MFVLSRMLERDEGEYECVAVNEHGEARQRVTVALAEHPKFITLLTETHALMRESFRLECQLVGVPYPDVKWYKDWQPVGASNRIKVEELVSEEFCIFLTSSGLPSSSNIGGVLQA